MLVWFSMIIPTLIIIPIIVWSDKSIPTSTKILSLLIDFSCQLLLVFMPMYLTKFEVAITNRGIYYRWYPFKRSYTFIPKENILSIENKKWPFAFWGYAKKKDWGRCSTVTGNKGFAIITKKQKYYLGTQKPGEMQSAVSTLLNRSIQQSPVSFYINPEL